VHDAAFSPRIDEFVVVYGHMPANATIFSSIKCEPIYQLGAGPHNTVRWNPFGRFICLAGFGNLPGDMRFFDRKADGKYKLIGKARAACSVRFRFDDVNVVFLTYLYLAKLLKIFVRPFPKVSAEWSPNGRYLLTATTAPRLNVDNGYKLWRYNGELLQHVERERLFEAKWQPAIKSTYADRPISPGRNMRDNPEIMGRDNAIVNNTSPYRPPHVTSGSGNFSLARSTAEEAGPRRYRPPGALKVNLSQSAGHQGPPGASFVDSSVSKNAAKNAKKRAAARAKKSMC
jgi:translation initiation factor 2A